MSSLLFYGPGSEDFALNESHKIGRLIKTFGSEGLKTEEAREAVSLINETPVGDRKGVILIGPMDTANEKASDVLLKSLEDFNEKVIQPILWAYDIGNVIPTIRSRCISKWCFAKEQVSPEMQELAIGLLSAWVQKDVKHIVDTLKANKKNLRDLLNTVVLFISQQVVEKPKWGNLWFPIRKVLSHPEPSYSESLVAFLPNKVTK